jgi:uncharacterized protein (DUF111 family)
MTTLKLDVTNDATRQAVCSAVLSALSSEEQERVHHTMSLLALDDHYAHVQNIVSCMNNSALPSDVCVDVCAIYDVLAHAEAQVHGCSIGQAHFHEVGNRESIASTVCIALAMHVLDPDLVVATPVQVGKGFITCAHGTLSVPAPATKVLLDQGIPVWSQHTQGERCTPTSAAIILYYVDRFVTSPAELAREPMW